MAAEAAARAEADDEETEEDTGNASLRDLLRFTLPTMAIWLCEPLLSLVDTSRRGGVE